MGIPQSILVEKYSDFFKISDILAKFWNRTKGYLFIVVVLPGRVVTAQCLHFGEAYPRGLESDLGNYKPHSNS